MASEKKEFQLEIPLDASAVEGFSPDEPVRIVLRHQDGKLDSKTVRLGKDGKGTATFAYQKNPGPIAILAGPGSATAEEILLLQTISLPAKEYKPRGKPVIVPIRIPPYHWHWWLRWCRKFIIRGTVTCPDGSPVPGAKVCARDVDFFWWWRSVHTIGCATTDENGSFELTFRWCCGWWPWYWWRRRFWHIEPLLAERILKLLRLKKLRKVPVPGPVPEIHVFENLLMEPGIRVTPGSESVRAAGIARKAAAALTAPATGPAGTIFNPAVFEKYRGPLQELIPLPPELDRFPIWPWYRWEPWWDCTPDVIFTVTQDCNNTTNVIVHESILDTRWNIPQVLNVTLVANDKACCVDPTPTPAGNCVNITGACSTIPANIGGNFGSPIAAPDPLCGFASPAAVIAPPDASRRDRPFAGVVPVSGDFGSGSGADYYEFEYSRTGAPDSFTPMPVGTVAGFSRSFFGPDLSAPGGMSDIHYVSFPVVSLEEDGTSVRHDVIESRQHYEANHGAGSWEVLVPGSRWWMGNKTRLANLMSAEFSGDDLYWFRVKAWSVLANGRLTDPRILTQCGSNPAEDNRLLLFIDNQVTGAASGHTAIHPCGTGTVHACTLEPDTDIVDVKIIHADGTAETVGPCGNLTISQSDTLQIDLYAYDTDRHLMYYTLHSTWKKNLTADILAAAKAHGSIAPLPAAALAELPPGIPAALQAGPEYIDALAQGATAPDWACGGVRVIVPATAVFPETCCYQLELRAYKRTIVSCQYDERVGHANLTEYSLGIRVT